MELLERDVELGELRACLVDADAGRSRVVLLGGEAGVGKTSFVHRFAELAGRSARVLIGACDPLSSPHPLGPLGDVASRMEPDVATLLRDPGRRRELFAAVLEDLATGPVTLFIIEDAHWADEATLDLLRYLGRRIERTRALLLVTYRDDEIGALHPLRSLLGDLATAPNVRRLQLQRLSISAVQHLATGSLIDPADLYRRTEGNPFFVTEVLAAKAAGVPATVRDAVLTRAARLSDAGRTLLDAAAVIGARIEPWLLAEVAPANIDACDECLDAGLLRVRDSTLAFRHELARAAVLEAMSPIRAIALHATVLSVLTSRAYPERNLARLAHHAEAAGDIDAVLEYAPEAARRATDAGAHHEAAFQYARALQFANELPGMEHKRILAAHLVESHLIGNSAASIVSAQTLIELARSSGAFNEEEANWQAWLAMVLVMAGENDAAETASHQSLELLADSPPSPQQLFAYWVQASLRMLNRDIAEAIDWSGRTLALADQFGDVQIRVKALNTAGAARIVGGDVARGRAELQQSLDLATEHGLEADAAAAYGNLGSAFGEMYQFVEADAWLTQGIAYASERDLDRHTDYMVAWLALTRLYQGRWTDAADLAERVLRNPTSITISRIMALLALGRVRARRGDPEVMTVLDEALELAERTATLQRLGPVRAARAEAAWLAGRADDAAAEASAAFDLAEEHRHRWHIGELGFWRWRTGAIVEPPALAAEPFALHIAGEWAGAAAAWQALGCPYEAARALAASDDERHLLVALKAFDQLGARPATAMVSARMRRLGFGTIPRGPRPATRANAAGLTTRETEVLGLLVQGRSNPDIANHLFLSSKTVEHHVSAILAKLQVQTRQEAALAAVERGLTR